MENSQIEDDNEHLKEEEEHANDLMNNETSFDAMKHDTYAGVCDMLDNVRYFAADVGSFFMKIEKDDVTNPEDLNDVLDVLAQIDDYLSKVTEGGLKLTRLIEKRWKMDSKYTSDSY